jgi:proteasome lid subunit RPN8/RPN11
VTLDLPAALRARIAEEARAAAPRECCGLIEGVRGGEVIRATALHPARNLARDDDRFEIDPAGQFRLLREGRVVVGCYHSHPGGRAEPSPRDAEGAGEVGFVWVVAGADGIGAYLWDGAAFQPMRLT